jgi:hypothetical protein
MAPTTTNLEDLSIDELTSLAAAEAARWNPTWQWALAAIFILIALYFTITKCIPSSRRPHNQIVALVPERWFTWVARGLDKVMAEDEELDREKEMLRNQLRSGRYGGYGSTGRGLGMQMGVRVAVPPRVWREDKEVGSVVPMERVRVGK